MMMSGGGPHPVGYERCDRDQAVFDFVTGERTFYVGKRFSREGGVWRPRPPDHIQNRAYRFFSKFVVRFT